MKNIAFIIFFSALCLLSVHQKSEEFSGWWPRDYYIESELANYSSRIRPCHSNQEKYSPLLALSFSATTVQLCLGAFIGGFTIFIYTLIIKPTYINFH